MTVTDVEQLDHFELDGREYRTYVFEQSPTELRAEDGDGREVTCLAVPYGYRQEIYPGLVEEFQRGAFAHQIKAMHRVHFSRGHMIMGGELIGRVHEGAELDRGLQLRMRVSDIPVGNDTLVLMRDKVLTEVSIGFRAVKSRDLGEGVVLRTKADLTEISVVLRGAYGRKATVTGIRSAGSTRGEVEGAPVASLGLTRRLLAELPPVQMIG